VFTKLIERNTTDPDAKVGDLSTASDNQTSVEVHVLQGERPMASDNRTLGKFHLVGIPPAPRGMPQVEVTFDLDANGIVNVSAKDMGTGREQKITITASSGLSKEEIDKMMKDAESHSADDARKREEIEARNRLDGLVYQMEKTLRDNREKVGAVAVTLKRRLLKRRRRWLKVELNELNDAFNQLQTCVAQTGRGAYPAGAAPGAERRRIRHRRPVLRRRTARGRQRIDAEYVDVEKQVRAFPIVDCRLKRRRSVSSAFSSIGQRRHN
jgi:molecular chaperone DnaK